MKELAKFEQSVGADGGKVTGKLGVEGQDLTVQISAKYPVEKVVEPALKVIDQLVDKLEQMIPGDQKAMAAQAKADARAAVIKFITEGEAAPALPETSEPKDVTPEATQEPKA